MESPAAVVKTEVADAKTTCLIYVKSDDKHQPIPLQAIIRANDEFIAPGNEEKWNGSNTLDLTTFGQTGILIETRLLLALDWSTPSPLTRKIMSLIFDQEVLATHTLSGKPSPAFRDRPMPVKKALDPVIIEDITNMIHRITGHPINLIRKTITTKCADETKGYRRRNSMQ